MQYYSQTISICLLEIRKISDTMRLLDVRTLEVKEWGPSPPRYAILSHRWGDEELSFQDMHTDRAPSMKGYSKILGLCRKAAELGLEHAWIDTCCIDKTSSAELSEAINSMYAWYSQAHVCFTYMEDVNGAEDPTFQNSSFRRSVWFTRGWTLQELIAPMHLTFFGRDWTEIGTKKSLSKLIEQITTIDHSVLVRHERSEISVAKRMSWAANRETTREEDRAYSLMGLFGVNMSPIYGEGSKAFTRLQHEIMRVSNDHSIFAWRGRSFWPRGLLAWSPENFNKSDSYRAVAYDDFVNKYQIDRPEPDYSLTNFGIHIQLPLQHLEGDAAIAYLAAHDNDNNGFVAIHLVARKNHPSGHYMRTKLEELISVDNVDLTEVKTERIFIAEDNPSAVS